MSVVAKVSRAAFAQSLAESGLIDLADVMPASDEQAADDGAGAAQELVAAGKLTRYQADALLAQRPADLRVGNYEILDRLGSGGMGTVFKARHRRMKRVVALKVLSREASGSERFLQRFQREVETIARLTHPNIVMAFDADEADCGPFLVMEYVNGRDLASEVAAVGRLSIGAALDRLLQAARGLEYAHAQGIVHRDIKPGNILIDVDGVVKVADLGLARLSGPGSGDQGSSLTQSGTVVGTADYMPPEQAVDSAAVDHRADIYSLGCTLFFMLMERPPFMGSSIVATIFKHRDAPIPNLLVRPDVPPELDALFKQMLAKQPEARVQTMAEVIARLEQIQSQLDLEKPAMPLPANDRTTEFASPFAAGTGETSQFELSEPPPGTNRLAALKVVAAESSRTQAGIIRSYLQQLGIDSAETTNSGARALELAKLEAVDVVVGSLHLSDMTGVQLAQALRADPKTAKVGFVLLTSESDADATAGLPHDSRTAIVIKPFDSKRLGEAVAAVQG